MEMDPIKFWKLTYAEFVEMVEGYVRRQRRRTNERTTDSWNTAYFSRVKKLPGLKEFLIDVYEMPGEKQEQSEDSMFALCRMWNAALGGVEVEV